MAAAVINTWNIPPDQGGPRRPSLEDCGGALVEDDVRSPNKGKDIYADLMNQLEMQVAAMGKVVPSAIVWVRFAGGTPAVFQATGPGDAVVTTGFFTVTHVGTGVTRIGWADKTLPPLTVDPESSMNQGPGQVSAAIVNPLLIEVKTFDGSGAPADKNFMVKIY